MYIPETPWSDFVIKFMSMFLWAMIGIAIVTICLLVLVTIIAVVFVLFDINYDWSWILSIGKT